ncbi:MAG: sulfotransferase [Pseudomonadota bacterium]
MAGLSPDQIKTLFADARAALARGQLTQAERGFARIIKTRPDLAEVHFNLGGIFAQTGRLAEAGAAYEAALKLKPREPSIWLSYVDVLMSHPDETAVARQVERVRSALGPHPVVQYFSGRLARRTGDPKAIEHLRAAKDGGIATEFLFADLAEAQAGAGDSETALQTLQDGARAWPGSARLKSQAADLLRDTARFEDARKAALDAIETEPKNGQLYQSYTSISRVHADDPVIARMERLWSTKTAKHPDRPYLAFALAKAMEDTGQRSKVFRYLDSGNRDVARKFPYGHDADLADLAEIRALADRLGNAAPKDTDQRPQALFVTGLPRSGTTLVEQIIAAHPDVTAGGELGWLGPEIARFRNRASNLGTPDLLAAAQAAGTAYTARTAAEFKTAYVTDKSISTFANIGLVRHMLPQARIVVVLRDPRDNALSIYKNLFRPGLHRYSTDLKAIARFTRAFEAQMAHWHSVCPEAFSTVQYEALIADPEPVTRQLVADMGLTWDAACLEFHAKRNRVKTLSSVQVRRPIYASSTGAWRAYARELTPFIEEYNRLGPPLDPDN